VCVRACVRACVLVCAVFYQRRSGCLTHVDGLQAGRSKGGEALEEAEKCRDPAYFWWKVHELFVATAVAIAQDVLTDTKEYCSPILILL
jgi:hypothetical protein